MTPRSSDPGGECAPLRGTVNLRLTAKSNSSSSAICFGVAIIRDAAPHGLELNQFQTPQRSLSWLNRYSVSASMHARFQRRRMATRSSRVVEETLHHRGTILVRRLLLTSSEATRWHRDPFHRVTVVLNGDALAIEFRDGRPQHQIRSCRGRLTGTSQVTGLIAPLTSLMCHTKRLPYFPLAAARCPPPDAR